MAGTPIEAVKIETGETLNQLFVEHDFDAKLTSCQQLVIEDVQFAAGDLLHPETIAKRGIKFKFHGITIAVIFYYTHANKKVTRHIRMLKIGNTTYRVIPCPPMQPQR